MLLPWEMEHKKHKRHKKFCASCASCVPFPAFLRYVRRWFDVKRAVADDHFRSLIVVLAHEFKAFAGCKSQIEAALPRGRVCPGIIDYHFVLDRVVIRTGEPFDHVKFVGRGNSEVIDPHTLVEPNGVDHERIAFPMSDRMSAVRG